MTEDVKIDSAVGSAVFSPDGRHRYRLDRCWAENVRDEREIPAVLWVMLNPSLAGAADPDPTIRKCEGFSRRWGYERMIVVNLFSAITPYPRELAALGERVGPGTDRHLVEVSKEAALVVCAWGKPPASGLAASRTGRTGFLLRRCPRPFKCLGRTSEGYPRHPSRLAYATELVEFYL